MARAAPLRLVPLVALVGFAGGGSPSRPPAIAILSPGSGPVGTIVTLDGRGLTGTTRVFFGGASARFRQLSPGKVIAVVPRRARTGPVSLSARGGSTRTSAVFVVRGKPLPGGGRLPPGRPLAITGLYPTAGYPGVLVELEGTGLRPVTRIAVGGVPAVFSVVDDTDVRLVVPRGARAGPIVVRAGSRGSTASVPFRVLR